MASASSDELRLPGDPGTVGRPGSGEIESGCSGSFGRSGKGETESGRARLEARDRREDAAAVAAVPFTLGADTPTFVKHPLAEEHGGKPKYERYVARSASALGAS